MVPATTALSSSGTDVIPPLQSATVPLVFPTGNVPGSVPQFSNLPLCAVSFLWLLSILDAIAYDFKQFCASNATFKNGGSIRDLGLVCKSAAVLESIGACESALCSPTDQLSESQNIGVIVRSDMWKRHSSYRGNYASRWEALQPSTPSSTLRLNRRSYQLRTLQPQQ